MSDAQQRGMRPAPLTRFRRGTTAEWEYANPVLQRGEPGWDSEERVLKVGDGETSWNDLEGIVGGGEGGGEGAVEAFPLDVNEEAAIFSYATADSQTTWSVTTDAGENDYSWYTYNEVFRTIAIQRPGLYKITIVAAGDLADGPLSATIPLNGNIYGAFSVQKNYFVESVQTFGIGTVFGIMHGQILSLFSSENLTGASVVVSMVVTPMMLLPGEDISSG